MFMLGLQQLACEKYKWNIPLCSISDPATTDETQCLNDSKAVCNVSAQSYMICIGVVWPHDWVEWLTPALRQECCGITLILARVKIRDTALQVTGWISTHWPSFKGDLCMLRFESFVPIVLVTASNSTGYKDSWDTITIHQSFYKSMCVVTWPKFTIT